MRRPHASARIGFTLAEVAVTIVIVGIGLVLVMQGLTSAKMSAAETHYRKIARELALYTLGQVESGLFQEELHGESEVLTGSYAEEVYDAFHYELVLGDEEFTERASERTDRGYHDTWAYEREREERAQEDDDEDEEEVQQPFEKVRVKVFYPQLGERPSELVLERWMAWDDVYGAEGEEGGSGGAAASAAEESP